MRGRYPCRGLEAAHSPHPPAGVGGALATLPSVKCKLKNKQGDADTVVGGAGRPKDSCSASNSNLLLTFLCSLGPGRCGGGRCKVPHRQWAGEGDLWDMGVLCVGHPHLRARGSWWPVLDSDGLTPVWPSLCTPLLRAWGSQLGDSDSPGLLLGPVHLGSLEVLFPQDRPVWREQRR